MGWRVYPPEASWGMACIGTGKIKEPAGLREALEIAVSKPDVGEAVMRILSQEASGRIGIKHGKVIVGAQITANGVTGYDALRAFLSLKRGMYYYLEAEEAGGIADLQQNLNVDVELLLSQGQDVDGLVQQFMALAEMNGWALSASLPPPRQPKVIPDHGAGSVTFGENFLDKIAETARSTFQGLKALSRKKDDEQPTSDTPGAKVFQDLENALSRSGAMQAQPAPPKPPLDQMKPPLDRMAPPLERMKPPTDPGAAPVPVLGRLQAAPPAAPSPPTAEQNLSDAAEQWAEQSTDAIWDGVSTAPDQAEPGMGAWPTVQAFEGNTPWAAPVNPFAPPGEQPEPVAIQPSQASFQPQQQLPQEHYTAPEAAMVPYQPAAEAQEYVSQQQQMPAPDPMAAWPRDAQSDSGPQQNYDDSQSTSQALSLEDLRRGPRTSHTNSNKFSMPSRDANTRARAAAERTSESQKLRTMDVMEEVENAAGATGKMKKTAVKRRGGIDLAAVGGAVITVGLLVVCILAFRTMAQLSNTSEFVEQAKKYIKQDKTDLAITQLTLALDKNPNDIDALKMRGQIYDKIGDLQHAEQDYEAVASKSPNDIEAILQCGLTRMRMGDLNGMLPLAKRVLDKNPTEPRALALQGIALAGLGKFDEALQSLNNTDESKLTTTIRACVNGARGYCYMHMKQPDKGVRCYETAIQIDPNNDGLYRDRAACFEQLDQYGKAIADLESATKVAPANAINYVTLARLYEHEKQLEPAIKAYKNAITLTPRPLDLYLKQANAQVQLGQYGDAIESCQLALKLQPMNKDAIKLKELAESKEKSAKPLAVASIDNSAEQQAEAADASLQQAMKLMSAGKYTESEKLLTDVIKKNPQNMSAINLLAHTLLYEHKNQAAFEQLAYLDSAKALALQDRFAYADCANLIGQPIRAVAILTECINLKPTWVEARVRLIKALVATGQVERARTVTEEGCLLTGNIDEKQRYIDAMGGGSSSRKP